MTIATHSLSNVVKGAGVPFSWPTEGSEWQMLAFGVRVRAVRYLDRSSSTTAPARPAPTEVGSRERAKAARSHLFNTELLQHYGQFETKAVLDCSLASSVQMVVAQ